MAGPPPAWGAAGGRDLISGLPDDLLHEILGRLLSTTAAARTSVLARRWRRVWADLPELVLGDDLIGHDSLSLDAVDGALAAHPAAHVHSLKITVLYDTPAHCVASWLRFASRRLAGALYLHVRAPRSPYQWEQWRARKTAVLELPPCEGATSIKFLLHGVPHLLLRPQPPPPGGAMFPALTDLEISGATMESSALGALVSTQCPCLRKLRLALLTLVAGVWSTCPRFVFADYGRHLRRLEVMRCSAMAPLMRWFDSVDELRLAYIVPEDGWNWKRFLDDATNTLPKCSTLWVSSTGNNHGFVPIVLRLLRRGNDIKKLCMSYTYIPSTIFGSPMRPCHAPKSSMADNTILDSLEEIEIDYMKGSEDVFVEFLKQLISNIWSMPKLKSVEINMLHSPSSLNDVVHERISAMFPPNISVRSNAFPNGRPHQII
ncbi:uncharacterized protein LOC125526428 [Triticum urartu]|uniref:uncharacterized protein LOC125525368 n=1 Tax=Triticum urartu TaxID=4572 RepID=UPI002043E193|nr:uncharacterized protein LOC125525368 [Triticum urartu]XP_048547097.1 uncharacterized protein LOC125526428 [Triticum urartu]XP_048547098.1 uncharacterized protein LOC125526428 [Triticum urartu]